MEPAPGSLDELRALQRLATLNSRQAVPPRHDYRPAEVGQWDEKDTARAPPPVDEQTQRLSQYWGAYMHQLQLLSQQADHQAPSASSSQSTAMLASLLASNPALLQAMQLPPAVVDAGVGALSSGPAQKESGADAKTSGDAADANTAVGAASTLQLGTAGSVQGSMLVTKPKAAVATQQPAFTAVPAAAPGPAPITSGAGGPTLTSSMLRTNSASAFVAAGSTRSIDLGAHGGSVNGTSLGAGAAAKRSATGDVKPAVGRRDSTALPPKKRLDAAAGDSTGDAERDAYSSLASLARMRSAGEASTATRSEDGNDAEDGGGAAGCSAMAAIKDSKEKNRQAQRRFRERQKSLIGDLRESVSALTRETEAQSKQIFVLQEENRLLKVLLQERSKSTQS